MSDADDGAATPAGANRGLAELRSRGEELLASGDDLVARLISGDSLAFLESVEQEGGE